MIYMLSSLLLEYVFTLAQVRVSLAFSFALLSKNVSNKTELPQSFKIFTSDFEIIANIQNEI